jgi:hypothetical protein
MAIPPTPSQTIGPFFHFSLPYPDGERLVPPADPDAVRIVGTVYDGAGETRPGRPRGGLAGQSCRSLRAPRGRPR